MLCALTFAFFARATMLSTAFLWLSLASRVLLVDANGPEAVFCVFPAVVSWNLAAMAVQETPITAADAAVALCVGVSPMVTAGLQHTQL